MTVKIGRLTEIWSDRRLGRVDTLEAEANTYRKYRKKRSNPEKIDMISSRPPSRGQGPDLG